MEDKESEPLLHPTSSEPSAPPPGYYDNTVTPSAPAIDQPPPYNFATVVRPSNVVQQPGLNTLYVQCRVCQYIINVSQDSQSRVVKCPSCHEATPIADPPPGKKYVRCPCNCLLTCSATAARVICPRPNCKRTIGVGTADVLAPLSSDRVRVICGKCSRSILWPVNESVARCPHCRSKSYLYRHWMLRRAAVFAVLGILMLLIGVGVTVGTAAAASRHGGIIVAYVGAFIVGIGFLLRSARYLVMTRSHFQ